MEWNGFGGIEVNSARFDRALRRGGYGIGLAVASRLQAGPGGACLELPDFPPVVVGAGVRGQANSEYFKQLLAELETEAQVQMRRMKGRARH